MFSLGRNAVRDPRIEGYNTFAGAAMASFMKIRTEMNLAVWKMRLKMSDPTSLIQLEMDIEERIDNKYKLLAELRGKNIVERTKLANSLRKQNTEIYKANLKHVSELTRKEADVIDDAIQISFQYAQKGVDRDTEKFINQKLNSLDRIVDEYVKVAEDVRSGKATIQDQKNALAVMANSWGSGLRPALDKAIGKTASEGESGEIALERAWLYAYGAPTTKLKGRLKRLEKEGKTAQASDVRTAILAMKEETNNQKFGSGVDLDIYVKHKDDAEDRDYAFGAQRDTLNKAYGYMTSAGRMMSPAQLERQVNKQLDIGPTMDLIKGSIPRLTARLEDITERRRQREAEQDRLIGGFGGMNLAFDPFSTRPSAVGDRMQALALMGETEQGLRDVAGVGEYAFPAGEGGNFSQFLKSRISQYDSKAMAAEGLSDADADWSGLGDAMDEISRSFKTFSSNLAPSDYRFRSPVKGLKGGESRSIADVLAEYNQISSDTPEFKDRAAANAFQIIKSGNAPVSKNYLKDQRFGSETEKKNAAYNDIYMPLKTNIGLVLNPKIESMRAARENEDLSGMVGSMQDIYQTIEKMPDDLLGSAGINIKVALEQIGGPQAMEKVTGNDAAIYRTALHIDDQYIAMNKQILKQNKKAESVFSELYESE